MTKLTLYLSLFMGVSLVMAHIPRPLFYYNWGSIYWRNEKRERETKINPRPHNWFRVFFFHKQYGFMVSNLSLSLFLSLLLWFLFWERCFVRRHKWSITAGNNSCEIAAPVPHDATRSSGPTHGSPHYKIILTTIQRSDSSSSSSSSSSSNSNK